MPGAPGMAVKLERILRNGPMARLELERAGSDKMIEAQIGSDRAHALALRAGDQLALRPLRARIFAASEAESHPVRSQG